MPYIAAVNRPNPVALVGAFAVPAGIGAALAIGLAVTSVIKDNDETLVGYEFKAPEIEPLPEPEPDKATPEPSTREVQTRSTQPVITRPDTPFDFDLTPSGRIDALPDLGSGPIGTLDRVDFGIPDPAPTATLDPIAAAPRGNPGGWITDRDYRPSWIRREYSGVAGFALEIDASGQVSDCTITRSTGHAALDAATCHLVTDRARFDPAKNSAGDPVPGRYTNAVNWRLPE